MLMEINNIYKPIYFSKNPISIISMWKKLFPVIEKDIKLKTLTGLVGTYARVEWW